VWQALYEELAGANFMVIAVAMDSREGDAFPWIEAAHPTYPTLIDREHLMAELFGVVNVPQAIWIDEAGRIVRPAEAAGAYEGFRKMNRATREMPEEVARLTAGAKSTYLDAVKDWVRRGPESEHALPAEGARAHLPALTEDMATAQAMFRLGQFLLRHGETEEGNRWLGEAAAGIRTRGASGARARGERHWPRRPALNSGSAWTLWARSATTSPSA
jgi:hypothetical protein